MNQADQAALELGRMWMRALGAEQRVAQLEQQLEARQSENGKTSNAKEAASPHSYA